MMMIWASFIMFIVYKKRKIIKIDNRYQNRINFHFFKPLKDMFYVVRLSSKSRHNIFSFKLMNDYGGSSSRNRQIIKSPNPHAI